MHMHKACARTPAATNASPHACSHACTQWVHACSQQADALPVRTAVLRSAAASIHTSRSATLSNSVAAQRDTAPPPTGLPCSSSVSPPHGSP
eukprot:365811-Chlamydomonas_euryale.AAC.2